MTVEALYSDLEDIRQSESEQKKKKQRKKKSFSLPTHPIGCIKGVQASRQFNVGNLM